MAENRLSRAMVRADEASTASAALPKNVVLL
jgi:hypothetical protein